MLETYLSKERDGIISEWFECIVTQYAPETAKFLRQQRDQFANPVGAGLRDELGPLFDGLVADADPDQSRESLDRIIRVRAVQDFEPSEALGFLLEIKRIVRDRVGAGNLEVEKELAAFDRRVDRLLLAAVNVFSTCREQVYEIRVKQIRKLSLERMERLNEWRANREKVGGSGATEPH
jgi:hypothetical protein